MEFIQKNIHMDRIKCAASAQIALEDDINITDAKPDVYQLIMEQGQVDVEEVRAVEDHVHVKGTLKFCVLYLSDEEVRRPACMEGALRFQESVFMDGVAGSDNVQVRPVLEDLSVGMINSRKLSVQSLLNLELWVETVEECQTAVGFEGEENVEMQKKILQALDLVISKKDIFRVRQELEIPNGMPNIFSLLWQSCQLKDVRWRILDEKMTLQGELSLFFIYEGEGEERPVIWHEATVPVSGSVECQGMREGMIENIRCRIGHKEIEVKPDSDGEERKIALDLVLDLDMKLYEEIQTDMIADLYGVTQEMEAVRRRGRCRQLVMKNTGKQKVSERFKTAPGMPGIQQLCGSFGEIQVGTIEPCQEGMKVEGAVSVRSMYTTTDTEIPFYCIRGTIPFSYMLEMPAADSGCICEVEPALEQLNVTMLDNNEVEARASLSFAGMCCRIHEEDMITDVRVSELDPEKVANLPGIVAYIVREGDTLWTIGKKYYVPVARMREMNDLGDREIRAGDKLLVVKGN